MTGAGFRLRAGWRFPEMAKPIVRPIYTVHQAAETEQIRNAVLFVTTNRSRAVEEATVGLWCCRRTPESGWFEETTWVEGLYDGEPDSSVTWIAHEEGLQP